METIEKLFVPNSVHMKKSHGNRARKPRHSITLESCTHVVTFFRNYGEEVALFLPDRVAHQRNIVKLLPSSETKANTFAKYQEAYKNANRPAVSLTSFKQAWYDFCPDIVIQQPRTGLCTRCQAAYVAHRQLRSKSEAEKTTFLDDCRGSSWSSKRGTPELFLGNSRYAQPAGAKQRGDSRQGKEKRTLQLWRYDSLYRVTQKSRNWNMEIFQKTFFLFHIIIFNFL